MRISAVLKSTWNAGRAVHKLTNSSCVRSFCNVSDSASKSTLKLEQPVRPFGALKISLPYSVHIRPLNPDVAPMMDKIIIEVNSEGNINDDDIWRLCKIDKLNDEITLSCDDLELDNCKLSCCVDVPLKFNLDVTTQLKGNVCIESMESEKCSVSTELGSVVCSKLKTGQLVVKTDGGHVICTGTVHGDIIFSLTDNGCIQSDKLQGNTINLCTQFGGIDVSSIYAEKSHVVSNGGKIKLSNLHGNSDVIATDGDVNIHGLDGSVNVRADNANINVHVNRLENVSVEAKCGNVDVSLPESVSTKVHLQGDKVLVAENLNFTGETDPHLKHWTGHLGRNDVSNHRVYLVTQNGSVSVKVQDWLSSLNLTHVNPEPEQ